MEIGFGSLPLWIFFLWGIVMLAVVIGIIKLIKR